MENNKIALELWAKDKAKEGLHFVISIVKSLVRIGACFVAWRMGEWKVLALGFGVAECIGMVEEVVTL